MFDDLRSKSVSPFDEDVVIEPEPEMAAPQPIVINLEDVLEGKSTATVNAGGGMPQDDSEDASRKRAC